MKQKNTPRKTTIPTLTLTIIIAAAIAAAITVVTAAPTDWSGDHPLQNTYTYTGHGKLIANAAQADYTNLDVGDSVTYSIDIADATGTVERAYLYIGLYQYGSSDRWTVVFDGNTLANNEYTTPVDTDVVGISLVRFDVTSMIQPGSYTYDVDITCDQDGFGVCSAVLVVVCSDPSEPLIYVWINDGSEALLDADSSTTFQDLGQPGGGTATLYTYVGDGVPGKYDELLFDGNVIASNPFDGSTGSLVDFDVFDVSTLMGPGGHTLTFRSTGASPDELSIYVAVLVYVPLQVSEYGLGLLLAGVLACVAVLAVACRVRVW